MAYVFLVLICFHVTGLGVVKTDATQACIYPKQLSTIPASKIDCTIYLAVDEPIPAYKCVRLACAVGSNAFVNNENERSGCQMQNCSQYLIDSNNVPTTTYDASGYDSYIATSTAPVPPANCREYTKIFDRSQNRSADCQGYQITTYITDSVELCYSIACSMGYNVYEYNGYSCRFYTCDEEELNDLPSTTGAGSFDIYVTVINGEVTTAVSHSETEQETNQPETEEDSNLPFYLPYIIGAVSGALLVSLIAVACLLVERKRKQKKSENEKSFENTMAKSKNEGVSNIYYTIGNGKKKHFHDESNTTKVVMNSSEDFSKGNKQETEYLEIEPNSVQSQRCPNSQDLYTALNKAGVDEEQYEKLK